MNIALIGYGKVAHLHAQAAQQVPGLSLVAVWGRDPSKGESFAATYGIRAFTDIAEMVRQERVDVCIVCTPHPAHAEPAVAAFEAGAHVLVEKPLAATLTDCEAIMEAARRNGRRLGVISQRRFYKACQRMREAIDAGKIGRPVLGTAQLLSWRDEAYYQSDPWRGSWSGEGGGVLINQAPHQLDLLLWYMGEIEEVYGLWRNLNHPYIEVDDTALAVIKFKNGGIGNVVVSNSQKPGIYGKIHIHGENGASVGAQTDGGMQFIAGMSPILEPVVNDIWTVPGETDHLEKWKAEDRDFFKEINSSTYFFTRQLADFCQAVREDREPLVTGEDGRRVVELISAIYQSTKSGLPVRLPL